MRGAVRRRWWTKGRRRRRIEVASVATAVMPQERTWCASAVRHVAEKHSRTGCAPPRSMAEMPHSREYHRHAVLVGGGNHLGVAHRAARLDHGADARDGGGVDAVAEREEGVRRHHRTAHFELLVAGLDACDLRAVH